MAKIEAYDRFKPFLDVFRKSESLKGLVKWKYDKENRVTLEAYPEQLKAFRKVVPKGEMKECVRSSSSIPLLG